eukprot:13567009-Alexandrium_andersonii.AAC.1
MFDGAGCGVRWTAALTSIGRIADCTLGALQCNTRCRQRWPGRSPQPGVPCAAAMPGDRGLTRDETPK